MGRMDDSVSVVEMMELREGMVGSPVDWLSVLLLVTCVVVVVTIVIVPVTTPVLLSEVVGYGSGEVGSAVEDVSVGYGSGEVGWVVEEVRV